MSEKSLSPPLEGVSRRTLLASGLGAVGAGAIGYGIGRNSSRSGAGNSPDESDVSDNTTLDRSTFWMSGHRNQITERLTDRIHRRFVASTNTTMQLIDVSHESVGSPSVPDPDDEDSEPVGAFRYTFFVESTAAVLAPAELGRIDDPQEFFSVGDGGDPLDVGLFPAASGDVDYVPAEGLGQQYRSQFPDSDRPIQDGAAQLGRAVNTEVGGELAVGTVYRQCDGTVGGTRGVRTTAVSVRRDPDLYGFVSAERAAEFFEENSDLSNTFAAFNPSDVSNANLEALWAQYRERQENQKAAVSVTLTGLSLLAGLGAAKLPGVAAKAFGYANRGVGAAGYIPVVSNVFELFDSASTGEIPAYQGFKQTRPPNARGPVGGFHAYVDVYVTAGTEGQFVVEYEHPFVNTDSNVTDRALVGAAQGDGSLDDREVACATSGQDESVSVGGRFALSVRPPDVDADSADDVTSDDYEITRENLPRPIVPQRSDSLLPPASRAWPDESADLGPEVAINFEPGPHEAGSTVAFDGYRTVHTVGGVFREMEWELKRLRSGANLAGDAYETVDSKRSVAEVTDSESEQLAAIDDGLRWEPEVEEPGYHQVSLSVKETVTLQSNESTADDGEGDRDGSGPGVTTREPIGRTQAGFLVTESDRPEPQIRADPGAIESGDEVTFTATNRDDETTVDTWTWYLPQGPFEWEGPNSPDGSRTRTGREITVQLPYTSDRKYEVSVVAETEDGTQATTVYELAVAPAPGVEVFAQPPGGDERRDEVVIPPGDTVTPQWDVPPTFDVANHAWSSGGEAVDGLLSEQPGTIEPVTVRFDERGEYSIRLWVADGTGASSIGSLDVTVGDTATAGWNQVHADTRNTAVGSNAALGEADTVSGTSLFEPGSVLATPLMAAGGTVYVGAGQTLYGVSSDGDVEWDLDLGTGLASTLALADGVAYCGLGTGLPSLSAVPVGSTEKRWESDVTLPYQSQPTVVGDRIYVGRESRLSAVSTEDGTLQWEANLGSDIKGVVTAPAVAGDTVYATSDDGNLYAVSRAEDTRGEVRWSYETGDRYFDPDTSAPTVGDGTVYFGTQDTALHAVSTDGEREWTFETPRPVLSSPAVGDGIVTFVSDDTLYCFSLDGERQWETETTVQSAIAFRSLAVVDGAVIAADPPGGSVTAYSTSDGEQLWTFDGGGKSPAVGEAALYVVGGGKLVAVSPE